MRVQLIRRLGQNKAGAVIDRTAPEAEQLVQQGYATHAADEVPAEQDDDEQDAEVDELDNDDLDDLTGAELKDVATREEVASYGTKAEIIARIRVARADKASEQAEDPEGVTPDA